MVVYDARFGWKVATEKREVSVEGKAYVRRAYAAPHPVAVRNLLIQDVRVPWVGPFVFQDSFFDARVLGCWVVCVMTPDLGTGRG